MNYKINSSSWTLRRRANEVIVNFRKNEVIRNDELENVGQSQGSGIPGLKNLNFNTPLTKSSVYHTLPTMISQNFLNEQDLDESTYWKNQHRRDLEKVSSVFDVKSP